MPACGSTLSGFANAFVQVRKVCARGTGAEADSCPLVGDAGRSIRLELDHRPIILAEQLDRPDGHDGRQLLVKFAGDKTDTGLKADAGIAGRSPRCPSEDVSEYLYRDSEDGSRLAQVVLQVMSRCIRRARLGLL